MKNSDAYFFYNYSEGKLIQSTDFVPQKRTNTYLVINRKDLLFNEFSIDSKNGIKTSEVLNIQKNYIPFKNEYLNVVYSMNVKERRNIFYWTGEFLIEDDRLVYDEIPESLIFKGDPNRVKEYNIFVFKRMSGYEMIFFNGSRFFSMFTVDSTKVSEKVVFLIRKFSGQNQIKILSEINLDLNPYNFQIDYIDGSERYFFLPAHYPLNKLFSNVAQNKNINNLKSLLGLTNKYLNVFFIFMVLFLLVNLALILHLSRVNSGYKKSYDKIHNVLNEANVLENKIHRIKKGIFSQYPDHMKFLRAISKAIDDDTFINEFALSENKININGFSNNSLLVLKSIRKHKMFMDAKFKSPVNKNIYSKKEKFEIEILLKAND